MDFSASPALGRGTGDGELQGLCDQCRKKAGGLKDKDLACPRPGCANTVAWTKEQQLEAYAQKRPQPHHLCTSCYEQLNALEAKEVPCTVPGCEHTATLTPKQQLLDLPIAGQTANAQEESLASAPVDAVAADAPVDAVAADAPAEGAANATTSGAVDDGAIVITGAMCQRCSDVVPRLRNRDVGCGINQCRRSWTWTAAEQLAIFVSGGANEPPRRLCTKCRDDFAPLADRQVRCRASGCKNSWTWTRSDQLDASSADKKTPKPPAHLCERCFKLWSDLHDVERPCRHPGCKKTWTDKRGAQLARATRGKTGDPYPQYCADHGQVVDQLQDREIACKTTGCDRTWKWTRNQQLAAGVRPEPSIAAVEHDEVEASAGPTLPIVEVKGAALTDGADTNGQPAADAQVTVSGSDNGTIAAGAVTASPADDKPADGKRKGSRRKRKREPKPPSRHCHRCADFLSGHKTIELPCGQCGTPIFWPPESQLQSNLGNWEIPKLCGACKRDVTEAERQRQREQLRHPQPHVTAPAATLVEATAGANASPDENTNAEAALTEPQAQEKPAEG